MKTGNIHNTLLDVNSDFAACVAARWDKEFLRRTHGFYAIYSDEEYLAERAGSAKRVERQDSVERGAIEALRGADLAPIRAVLMELHEQILRAEGAQPHDIRELWSYMDTARTLLGDLIDLKRHQSEGESK